MRKETGKIERIIAGIIALGILFPLAMIGLLFLKIFRLEDWMARKIARYVSR